MPGAAGQPPGLLHRLRGRPLVQSAALLFGLATLGGCIRIAGTPVCLTERTGVSSEVFHGSARPRLGSVSRYRPSHPDPVDDCGMAVAQMSWPRIAIGWIRIAGTLHESEMPVVEDVPQAVQPRVQPKRVAAGVRSPPAAPAPLAPRCGRRCSRPRPDRGSTFERVVAAAEVNDDSRRDERPCACAMAVRKEGAASPSVTVATPSRMKSRREMGMIASF